MELRSQTKLIAAEQRVGSISLPASIVAGSTSAAIKNIDETFLDALLGTGATIASRQVLVIGASSILSAAEVSNARRATGQSVCSSICREGLAGD